MNIKVHEFKSKYGSIINQAVCDNEIAYVGKTHSDNIYFVFYPDGEVDRFDDTNSSYVKYRSGWSGDYISIIKEYADEDEELVDILLGFIDGKVSKTKTNIDDCIIEKQKMHRYTYIPKILREFIDKTLVAFNEVYDSQYSDFKTFKTSYSAYYGILNCGYFLSSVSNYTESDVERMEELPEMFKLYIGSHFVGNKE